jgi:quercetin dioxygenase-like cupin family protein
MCQEHFLRFVTDAEAEVELLPWGHHAWLSRERLTGAEQLQLVRVKMPPGKAHAFHRHPGFEEILYVLEGRAEQWVGRSKRILGPGETAFVPIDEVHGTYNVFAEPLTFLAILSPARFDGPALIDVSQDEPWKSIRSA